MPLDQVRTQVLLLHSEQSTLDTLSSGFNDRYTVHCATSGTEALNTLGETPIHVIVCAKDLPGMSGVEALREAKKRSPETIGILLAGEEDEGVEALVGEKEVFQVVKGGVTPSDLGRLIDGATQQMRLMALAESANDTAANPDEPAEHIIMETSENGATIITDATGRLPVLDPKKVAAAAATGAQAVDVLVVTKDQEFLDTVRESSRGLHNIRYANTLAQAEEAIQKHNVGVAVVDAAMVGENVEKLTMHLRSKKARLVNIVAGRRDDGDMLMDLINRGRVYRFLLKPVSPGRARLAIEASVKHHLEAPDEAFKMPAGSAPAKAAAPAPKPQPKPASTPAPKPAPKPEPKPVATAAPKPALQPAPRPAAPQATKRPEPPPIAKAPPKPAPKAPAPDGGTLLDDELSSAFGGDDTSFTETMTGIVANIGDKLVGNKSTAREAPKDGFDNLADSGSGGLPLNPKLLGIGATLLVAVAAVGFWMFSGGDEPGSASPADTGPAGQVTEAEPNFDGFRGSPSSAASADELLDSARAANDAGRIFNPPGNNAIEFYVAALEAAPGSEVVAAELDATIGEALGLAESALLERRTESAAAALERVTFADPDNPRLPFLTAQLSQMQYRDYLDSARAAIRDARFEDAAQALSNAGTVGSANDAEVAAIRAELSQARSAQRVEDVLAQATDRLDRGMLLRPANDNARYYFQLVLSNDPDNAAALAGIDAIAGRLVLQARTEIDAGDFRAAESLLDDARQLDPSSDEVGAAVTALRNARTRAANAERERQQQAAARQAEAERTRQAESQAADAAAAAEQDATDVIGEPVDVSGEDAEPVSEYTAEEVASNDAADAVTQGEEPAEPGSAINETPVAMSSLTRIKYVAPKYPRAAERRNLSGWVDVVFTVGTDGETKDIEILNSDPGDVFVSSARRAVERWEFMPVVEDGITVEKRVGVRLMFALE